YFVDDLLLVAEILVAGQISSGPGAKHARPQTRRRYVVNHGFESVVVKIGALREQDDTLRTNDAAEFPHQFRDVFHMGKRADALGRSELVGGKIQRLVQVLLLQVPIAALLTGLLERGGGYVH